MKSWELVPFENLPHEGPEIVHGLVSIYAKQIEKDAPYILEDYATPTLATASIARAVRYSAEVGGAQDYLVVSQEEAVGMTNYSQAGIRVKRLGREVIRGTRLGLWLAPQDKEVTRVSLSDVLRRVIGDAEEDPNASNNMMVLARPDNHPLTASLAHMKFERRTEEPIQWRWANDGVNVPRLLFVRPAADA